MSDLPSPNWLRTFEAAARLGGFKAAGDALGLTPAAVSQQIRALEGHLGFRLFDRQPRGVTLTEMGHAYLPSVRRAFEDLETATAGLFGLGDRSSVMVRAPISFATLCLVPVLHDFHARYPGVSIRLCTSIWAETAEDSTIDLDIRYGVGRWRDAEVMQLSEPVSLLVCPPGTAFPADRRRLLQREARRAIHVSGYEGFWAGLGRQHGLDKLPICGAMAADSSLVALEMVAGGLGAAIIARELACRHLARGTVTSPEGLTYDHKSAHYLVRPRSAQSTAPAILLFRNWLMEQDFASGAVDGAVDGARWRDQSS